jgi:hypothetical protein
MPYLACLWMNSRHMPGAARQKSSRKAKLVNGIFWTIRLPYTPFMGKFNGAVDAIYYSIIYGCFRDTLLYGCVQGLKRLDGGPREKYTTTL